MIIRLNCRKIYFQIMDLIGSENNSTFNFEGEVDLMCKFSAGWSLHPIMSCWLLDLQYFKAILTSVWIFSFFFSFFFVCFLPTGITSLILRSIVYLLRPPSTQWIAVIWTTTCLFAVIVLRRSPLWKRQVHVMCDLLSSLRSTIYMCLGSKRSRQWRLKIARERQNWQMSSYKFCHTCEAVV